jgi:23S rRNA pseudouridine1911/1915/1917 synthase
MKRPEMPEDGVNRVTLEIEDNYSAGERLDVLVTRRLPKISRNRVQKLIGESAITVNGTSQKASFIVMGGEVIEVVFPHPPRPPAAPENIPLDVFFEDDHFLIVNKPAGMVVHPAAGHHSGTLVNALLYRYQSLPVPDGPTHRPGIVHRLDKETSGLLVVAKTENMMTGLGRLFHEHDIKREYVALVWGDPEDKGTVDAPIGRHTGDRKRYAINRDGKHAITHWRVLERYGFLSLIACTLETGRTHQIRVHMTSKGWPIFGDSTYNGRLHSLSKLRSFERDIARKALELMPRQALHARILGFVHPETREDVFFETEIPDDFISVINFLKTQLEID